MGAGQSFKQFDVERTIFRNLEIPNKDELFDFFNFEFVFYFHIYLNCSNTKIYDNYRITNL